MGDIMLPGLKAHLIYWPLTTAGLLLDLWSKNVVFDWLSRKGQPVVVFEGFLNFVVRENAGAAFSIAYGQRTLLVVFSAVALILVFGIFLFGRIKHSLGYIALALFTAGVLGNLYDRMFNNGLVRDFIDVHWHNWHWPAFNIADSMLCIAVGLLIISVFRRPDAPSD